MPSVPGSLNLGMRLRVSGTCVAILLWKSADIVTPVIGSAGSGSDGYICRICVYTSFVHFSGGIWLVAASALPLSPLLANVLTLLTLAFERSSSVCLFDLATTCPHSPLMMPQSVDQSSLQNRPNISSRCPAQLCSVPLPAGFPRSVSY